MLEPARWIYVWVVTGVGERNGRVKMKVRQGCIEGVAEQGEQVKTQQRTNENNRDEGCWLVLDEVCWREGTTRARVEEEEEEEEEGAAAAVVRGRMDGCDGRVTLWYSGWAAGRPSTVGEEKGKIEPGVVPVCFALLWPDSALPFGWLPAHDGRVRGLNFLPLRPRVHLTAEE